MIYLQFLKLIRTSITYLVNTTRMRKREEFILRI